METAHPYPTPEHHGPKAMVKKLLRGIGETASQLTVLQATELAQRQSPQPTPEAHTQLLELS